MPIVGLTDQPHSFYEIGQLRKGAPKPDKGNRPGEDLTYFRATFNEGEERAVEMFTAAYGQQPREINIRLPFNEVDENFEAWREEYVAGGLVHRCDGAVVQYEIDPGSGEVMVMDGLSTKTNKPVECKSAGCKPTGRLKVIVPELRRLAFMTVLTTSVWDIANLSRQLGAIRFANNGRLQNIPLIIKRRPKKISTPGGKNGKRARYEKWLLSIEPDPDWVEAKILAYDEDKPLQLPPGVPDTNGHEEEVEGEVSYEIEESGEVWEDERPVYEVGAVPTTTTELYQMAKDVFGLQSEHAADVFQGYLDEQHGGGDLGAFIKMGGEENIAILWSVLTEHVEAENADLSDVAVDFDGVPF